MRAISCAYPFETAPVPLSGPETAPVPLSGPRMRAISCAYPFETAPVPLSGLPLSGLLSHVRAPPALSHVEGACLDPRRKACPDHCRGASFYFLSPESALRRPRQTKKAEGVRSGLSVEVMIGTVMQYDHHDRRNEHPTASSCRRGSGGPKI